MGANILFITHLHPSIENPKEGPESINLVPYLTHRGRLVNRGRCFSFDQPSAAPEIKANSNPGR